MADSSDNSIKGFMTDSGEVKQYDYHALANKPDIEKTIDSAVDTAVSKINNYIIEVDESGILKIKNNI